MYYTLFCSYRLNPCKISLYTIFCTLLLSFPSGNNTLILFPEVHLDNATYNCPCENTCVCKFNPTNLPAFPTQPVLSVFASAPHVTWLVALCLFVLATVAKAQPVFV